MNNAAKPSLLSDLVRPALVLAMFALLAGCGRPFMPAAPSKELTKEQFFAHLDSLTILELSDYIKEFETRYSISAAAAAPAFPEFPSVREQAALYNGWLKERFDRVLPAVISAARGSTCGSSSAANMPRIPSTRRSCPSRTCSPGACRCSFSSTGATRRASNGCPVNPYGSGDFNREIDDYYLPGWTEKPEDPWARLARIVRERDPKRIAIDESRTFAFADGLSATMRSELAAALGPGLSPPASSPRNGWPSAGWKNGRPRDRFLLPARRPQPPRRGRGAVREGDQPGRHHPRQPLLVDARSLRPVGVEAWFQPTFYIVRRAGQGTRRRPTASSCPATSRGDIGFLPRHDDRLPRGRADPRAGETEAPGVLRKAMGLRQPPS